MIAVIKGDIIGSRKQQDQEKWLLPLKELLSQWGDSPKQWELVWGDFFQVEIEDPEEVLHKALAIKALIMKTETEEERRKFSSLNVRMSIGIGEKTYSGSRISESNGPAFIFAGEKFESLNKENITLAIKSPWAVFDEEMNLYLRLAGTFMDTWSVPSAEIIEMALTHPNATQEEIGKQLGIKQNSVSGRWNRAHTEELLAVEKMFRSKIKKLLV